MQILDIVLYSRTGKRRVVSLRTGAVNIITGESRKGKSALLEIVDYCLGSGRCHIPAGVIRDLSSWYGLRLQVGNSQIFIARANPPPDAQSTNAAFVLEGPVVDLPQNEPAGQNTTIEAIELLLAEKLRIGDYKHTPAVGQTRSQLSVTLRHSLAYCLQAQDEIASKQVLFHGQADTFVKQAMKDTLPYFLGAVREDEHALILQLADLRRSLKVTERRMEEIRLIGSQGFSKGAQLMAEAKALGIISGDESPKTERELIVILQKALEWSPQAVAAPRLSVLNKLESDLKRLEAEIESLDWSVTSAEHFLRDAGGFESEAKEQEVRLTSIGLYDLAIADHKVCPFCEATHPEAIVDLNGIRSSIESLNMSLENVLRTRPKLQRHLEGLRERRVAAVEQRNDLLTKIRGVQAATREFRVFRDRLVQAGVTLGKIGLWLESIAAGVEDTSLSSRASELRVRISAIDKQLNPEEKEQRLRSILNRIATRMTDDSRKLNLEHSSAPIHLDIKEMTVVIDKPERPITLRQTGSGENWVGYHLVALLALHSHFLESRRPVPRFLILDQPSQIYFPADTKPEAGQIQAPDADREALARLYERMFTFTSEAKGEFQILVLDHARLQRQEFVDAIREDWHGDVALIPSDWMGIDS